MLPRLFRRDHNHKTTKSQVSEGLLATPTAIGTQEPSSPMMDLKHKHKHRKPKLERRNAIKNIDYDASSSPDSSLRTRSLDLPTTSSYGGQTSFRVEGIDVGEFDRICRNLGLSGPEDFAIPAADWERRKTRSSSNLFPRSRLRDGDGDGDGDGELDDDEPSSTAPAILLSSTLSDSGLLLAGVIRDAPSHENGAITSGDPGFARISSYPSQAECRFQTKTELTGGIKGARPPVLAPPPAMSLPVLNKMFSTWDIVRSFAPDEDEANGIFGLENKGGVVPSAILEGRYSCQDVEEEEEEKEEEDDDDDDEDGVVEENGRGHDRLGETDLTGSSTFSTSNDDDSSSTTTEPMFVISPNGRFKRHIKSWIRGGILGSGSFGTVYEGISDDGFFFAVKEVSLLDQGSRAQQCILQLEQEIALLSQFEHENIVQYFGTDKEEAKLYIFLELVTQGSLSSLYQKYHLRDSQVSAYTRQILHGLKYLHDRNVMHRDIKCANILVDASGSVKLADFGLAKETSKLNRLKSCKGSAYWMAPEVVNPRKTYSLAADIWSLGCSVLEMLTRQLPYSDLEWTQALFKIGRGEGPHIPNALSRDARDFIQQCLQVDPEDRPSASKLVDHPFVKRPLSDRRLPKPS